MLSPKIETERLILRRYQESDLDAIYEIITDERLSKYIKFPNLTREEELECIRKWICEADESKYEKWVIEIKATGEVAGNIDVNTVVKKHNYCNVGYTIRYNYWGNGYAAEALKAVSDHLLNNSGYYLVECSCNELNVQSYRVMEKAGFKKDGYIANRRLNKDGTYSGVVYYSKTRVYKAL
ncbi:MAG: GNAT family N-acetyltransferase [Clostridia bacterium]|nr:GNAT family N-acetyltransferase [Clostridia bacterium]